MDFDIALVQFRIGYGDPVDNIARMAQWIEAAAARGARLVVFPEDAVTGPLAARIAQVTRAPEFPSRFGALAVKHRVDPVPGSWVVRNGAAFYNGAIYINSDGTVAGSYSKISLWPTEQASLQPGTAISVFPTAHGVVALAICWDLAFPALFAQMKAQSAQLVLAPSYWSFTRPAPDVAPVVGGEIDLIDSLCLTRAFENNLAIAYCNAAGDLQAEGLDAVLSGRSQLVHPVDKVVVRADGNEEDLVQTLIANGVGAFVTWIVAWIYYRQASRDLATEAEELRRLSIIMLRALEGSGLTDLARDEKGNIKGLHHRS